MEFGTKRDQGGPGYFKPFAGDGVAVKLYAMWWYNQGGGATPRNVISCVCTLITVIKQQGMGPRQCVMRIIFIYPTICAVATTTIYYYYALHYT